MNNTERVNLEYFTSVISTWSTYSSRVITRGNSYVTFPTISSVKGFRHLLHGRLLCRSARYIPRRFPPLIRHDKAARLVKVTIKITPVTDFLHIK